MAGAGHLPCLLAKPVTRNFKMGRQLPVRRDRFPHVEAWLAGTGVHRQMMLSVADAAAWATTDAV